MAFHFSLFYFLATLHWHSFSLKTFSFSSLQLSFPGEQILSLFKVKTKVFFYKKIATMGGFHKPIYALCKALTLCTVLLCLKSSQKFDVKLKIASHPNFSLNKIDPMKGDLNHRQVPAGHIKNLKLFFCLHPGQYRHLAFIQ